MKTEGYKVTITGTLPVDVSSVKSLRKTAAMIAEAEGGNAAGVLKQLQDVSVLIADGSAKRGRKPGKKARAGGKKRGRKPKEKPPQLPLDPSPSVTNAATAAETE